jgi:hypothetical protein
MGFYNHETILSLKGKKDEKTDCIIPFRPYAPIRSALRRFCGKYKICRFCRRKRNSK